MLIKESNQVKPKFKIGDIIYLDDPDFGTDDSELYKITKVGDYDEYNGYEYEFVPYNDAAIASMRDEFYDDDTPVSEMSDVNYGFEGTADDTQGIMVKANSKPKSKSKSKSEFNGNPYINVNKLNFDENGLYIEDNVLACGLNKKLKPHTIIPEGVTTIGAYAFYDCTNLMSVTIPKSVNCIDAYAFAHCSNLTDVVLSEGLSTIKMGAFEDCMKLNHINLPDSVINLEINSFSRTNLTYIALPKNLILDSKYNSQFRRCPNLRKVFIPKTLDNIGKLYFDQCKNITDVYYEGSKDEYYSKLLNGLKANKELLDNKDYVGLDNNYDTSFFTANVHEFSSNPFTEAVKSQSKSGGYKLVKENNIYKFVK